MRAALVALAARYGIAADFHDIWGRRHEVSEANLAVLLRQFGVDAGTPEKLQQALEAADQRPALPPVALIEPDCATHRIRLQSVLQGERLHGRVAAEDGRVHEVQARLSGEQAGAQVLEFDVLLPLGYHRFELRGAEGSLGHALLVAAPPRCWEPPEFAQGLRFWGPAVQLYALRSSHDWGIGDFGDLQRVVEQWAALGAGAIGLNPLHALFPHNPQHISPYSPSSRIALNVLYLDIEALDDFRESERVRRQVRSKAFQARLQALRQSDLVDYPGVSAVKFEVLERLYQHFRRTHLVRGSERGRAFRSFQSERGQVLRRHALHEALQELFHHADSSVWGWQVWPQEYRDAEGEPVARFAAEHIERVEFYEYLQWQAELQLGRVNEYCRALGLGIGLYVDLSVSVDRAGSDAWAYRECYATEASVGAPPDAFNLNGQDWGLPPLRPDRLRERMYAPYIEALRAGMRRAGALRIDHVMGLMRLYWVPPGASPREGAYVHYPVEELFAILALESHRNRCVVIGEDLGTVPDAMREFLARYGVLSYRLLIFEREQGGEFKPPQSYPVQALVAPSTHDLPTLAGWWSGRDIALRRELRLFQDPAALDEQSAGRAQDRARLLRALQRAGLWPQGDQDVPESMSPELSTAVHAYLARAPSRLMMVQLEDALGLLEQANLPGTTIEHPNWRRRLPARSETAAAERRVAALAGALAKLRPHPPLRKVKGASAPARIPRATYRLQLHGEFTFQDALSVVPYLAKLGISHLYCSPILSARPGSRHGYDIVDHNEINPELGGRAGFERLVAAAQASGMGLLFDLVPNHMGVLEADNAWWMDVLENGPASEYSDFFDIDWNSFNPDLAGKVLIPVLGEHYGDALEKRQLELRFEAQAGSFALIYYKHRLPLDPRSYPAVLGRARESLEEATPAARDALAELCEAFSALPAREGGDAAHVRGAKIPGLKQRLADLARMQPSVMDAVTRSIAAINAAPGELLHPIIATQAFRLAYWRVASDEINYRRFFDINDLAALRMEHEPAFEATHALALSLAADGMIDGLRIDHPDGLYDPGEYFSRLQQEYAWRTGAALLPDADGRPPRPLYVLIEKIIAAHERIPERWPIHGTTGYRFIALTNGLFIDGAAQGRIERIWRNFSGMEENFEEAAYRGKRAILRNALSAELSVLATQLWRIARRDRRTCDYSYNTLRQALQEVAACMPVYRTYIAGRPSKQDRRYVDWAVARARQRSRTADTTVFGFVREALLARSPGADPELAPLVRRLAMRFQQFCAPVAAKGVEDTAFYRSLRLASQNEVGCDPGGFGITVRAFHGATAERAALWPHTMLGTSTHDNKRSEDVRQRINVISEIPAAWRLLLRRWHALNRSRRTRVGSAPAPSPADEYLLYQTLLGSFPPGELGEAQLAEYCARIERYMIKAAREAKQHTSWVSPNEQYEAALTAYVRGLLGKLESNPFVEDLKTQAAATAWFGALNSIAMMLLKYTSPGVPDLYQGNELLDYSLVDPDNRRAVDYVLRRRLLEEVMTLAAAGERRAADALRLAESLDDGRAKLYVIWCLLDLRRAQPGFFRDAGYKPLAASGARAGHVIAYARQHAEGTLITIAGRLHAKLLGEPRRLPVGEVWADTRIEAPLPEATKLTNVLTGETIQVSGGGVSLNAALKNFPVAALLASGEAGPGRV